MSHLVEVLGSQTGVPKGSKENQKFRRRGGVNDFEIRKGWGIEHFQIFEGEGEGRGG